MSEALKAIPTEYKGVRFRSKSEAIFARCLDLAGFSNVSYEPKVGGDGSDWNIPPHDWDFLAIYPDKMKSLCAADYVAIEYKPRRPTDVYIENLKNKVFDRYYSLRPSSDSNADANLFKMKVSDLWSVCESVDQFMSELKKLKDWFKDWKASKNTDVYQTTFGPSIDMAIVYGSPYAESENDEHTFSVIFIHHLRRKSAAKGKNKCQMEIGGFILGITEEMAQEARSYRFDLKH